MNFLQRIIQLFSQRREVFKGPDNREWQKLIQQNVRRVPTDELGRRRAARSRLPVFFASLFFVTLVGIIWFSIDEESTSSAKPTLRYKTDGFMTVAAVQKTVMQGVDGAGKDVATIKKDLEVDPQVLSASVRRLSDGTLDINLKERVAIGRVALIAASGPMVVRLVSPEGTLFSGTGYPEQSIRYLPEIVDFRTTGAGEKISIEGIEIVGPFLLEARSNYERLYKQWAAVSMRDCFNAQEDAPGSNLRVIVSPRSQPADRPALATIVFSTANWRNELLILSRMDLDGLLRRPGLTANSYMLKLSIQNRTSGRPTPEPRLVPTYSR